MKKYILFSLFALFVTTSAFAQTPKADLRTLETKVADLLMKFPPASSADLDKLMAELASMGDGAVKAITANLVPPGMGNDAASRYALSGLSKYAAKGADPQLMKNCAAAFCEALQYAKDEEVKDFLLQELQYVAGNEAVPVLSPYLLNKRLCDPAARVLVRINSPESNNALANALSKAKTAQQIIIAEALGQVKYAPAVPELMGMASASDGKLKKTVLRALAETGNPDAATLLAAEAEKAGYTYDPADATASYLLFLKRSAEKGNSGLAAQQAQLLIQQKALPVHTRSAALQLLAAVEGQKAVPALLKALQSAEKEYRMASLSQLRSFCTPEVFSTVRKIAGKTKNTEQKAELITWLAAQGDALALPMITKQLKSKDKSVLLAAIPAVARLGKADAITSIMPVLATGSDDILKAAKTTLLTIPGLGVTDAVAKAIPGASGAARCAMIDIIGQRCDSRHAALVFEESESNDPAVRLAAQKALASVVKKGDEGKIAGLLNKAANAEEFTALQSALYAALKELKTKPEQTQAVVGLMNVSKDKQSLYSQVLARIGGHEALAVVEKQFENGNPEEKEMAFKGLAGWSDGTALMSLYRIAKSNASGKFGEKALSGFIAGINASQQSTDQKVLMFRNAMELATTVDQKKQVLRGISRNITLPAMVFVSAYLDNPELQQTAVEAMMSMAEVNGDFYGPVVEKMVQKALSLNNDAEADYQKQAVLKKMASFPKEGGFVAMFNGKDLTGWKGLVGNPVSRAKMTPTELAEAQVKADQAAAESWKVENGILLFTGKGNNLCSDKDYGDFEMLVDWKLFPGKEPDAGIYLRGTPQVQIWDTSRVNVGAQVGSGGLYNNQKNVSKPPLVADNAVGEWNSFRIKMIGEKVSVWLNGQLVVDNVTLENYWDRNQPIFPVGSIELQAHGSVVGYRDIYVKELPRKEPYQVAEKEKVEGFVPLFNGVDMSGWTGNLTDYSPQDGMIVCQPTGHGSGNLYTEKEYSDFILRFEFQLTPGANNGLGIRTPLTGDAAYVGMELQILDNEADIYKSLQAYQYHGSVYGVIPAKRGFLKPVGEWNVQEVQAIGNRIKVTLNGEVILDGDIAKASKNNTATADHREHPGLLNKTGHIGFLGHGSPLKFRNLRIKEL